MRYMKMILYIMVTRDKYELPLAVDDTAAELARMVGVTTNAVLSGISKARKGKLKKAKYIRVEVDNE